jgi:hypothetical protein
MGFGSAVAQARRGTCFFVGRPFATPPATIDARTKLSSTSSSLLRTISHIIRP